MKKCTLNELNIFYFEDVFEGLNELQKTHKMYDICNSAFNMYPFFNQKGFIALLDEHIIGFLCFDYNKYSKSISIQYLCAFNPICKGVGSILINLLESYAYEDGNVDVIKLAPTNEAILFYEKLGYYPDHNELFWQKYL